MNKKIYISGKISGIENDAYVLFENAERHVNDRGYIPVNPMKLPHDHNKSWESYMKEDIKALCDCDEIYMLKNYKESRGAMIEHQIAFYLGIKINYE